MDRIKSVIHHGHRKSADATHKDDAPSSTGELNRGPTGEGSQAEEYHPIYDQFSSTSSPNTSGDPATTKSEGAPIPANTHVSQSQPQQINTAIGSSDKPTTTPTSSLRPDTAHDRQGLISEGASAASIKSGVIGFPQGPNDQHAAMGKTKTLEDSLDRTQAMGSEKTSDDAPIKQNESSHFARDAGIATGVAGATGAGAYAAHEFNDQPKEEVAKRNIPEQVTSESYLPEPSPTTDTDRSFPLVGGVVTRRSLHKTPAEHKTETNEREPGTKDKEVGVRDGEGRETLAGAGPATAASTHPHTSEPNTTDKEIGRNNAHGREGLAGAESATAASMHPHTSEPNTTDREIGRNNGHGREGLAGAAALAAATASTTRSHTSEPQEDVTPRASRTEDSYHPDALAAATAAAGTTSAASHPAQHHQHTSTAAEPTSTGTDQAGVTRPSCGKRTNTDGTHLHIPGEFPDPTPAEEPAEPSFGAVTNVESTSDAQSPAAHHELRHTGTLDHPQSKSPEESPERSHLGTGAAVGAGAAGLAGYEAGKHYKDEQLEAPQSSPYSATKLDPRVDARTASASKTEEPKTPTKSREADTIERRDFGEQSKADEHHYGRDTAIVGGVGAAGYGISQATKKHDESSNPQPVAPVEEQRQDAIPVERTHDQAQAPVQQSSDEKHHYGRDAALAGGAGLASYGVYEASRHHGEQPNTQTTAPVEEKPLASTTTETQDPVMTSTHPSIDEKHHYGRDTAIAGGATGYGSHEAAKHYTEHPSTQQAASIQDQRYDTTAPSAHDPATTSKQPGGDKEHHYGRDAAVAGGAGAAGYGVYEASKRHGEPINTQTTAPVEEKPFATTTAGTHDPITTSTQPSSDEKHHYGRDATIAGGAGAAGYGAYEAVQDYSEHPSTQSAASLDEQRYDPTAPGAHDPNKASSHSGGDKAHHYGRDAAIAGGLGAAGATTYGASRSTDNAQPLDATQQHQTPAVAPVDNSYNPSGPNAQYSNTQQTAYPQGQVSQDSNQPSQHHYGRDAAVAGGLAATGAGVYAATRGHQDTQQYSQQEAQQYSQQYPQQHSQQYPEQHSQQYTQQYPQQYAQQYPQQYPQEYPQQQPTLDSTTHQRYDSVQDPSQSHQKRNVAAAGAGAAAAGGAAYAYTQHDAEKERLAQQKALDQRLKEENKDFEKQQKEREKAYRKEEKEMEKQQAKEQKHHNKLVMSEEKKHQKEAEKAEKDHMKAEEKKEKEREKEAQKEDKEKKHHLFGFLHRDKKEKEDQSPTSSPSPRLSKDSPRLSKDYSPPPAAATSAASPEPAPVAANEAENPVHTPQQREPSPAHASDPGSGSDTQDLSQSQTSSHKKRNRLHKTPPKGHPAREALEQQQQQQQSEGGVGNEQSYGNMNAPVDGQNQNYPGAMAAGAPPHAY